MLPRTVRSTITYRDIKIWTLAIQLIKALRVWLRIRSIIIGYALTMATVRAPIPTSSGSRRAATDIVWRCSRQQRHADMITLVLGDNGVVSKTWHSHRI